MLSLFEIKPIRNIKLRKIAKQVRAGILPKGVSQEEVVEALKATVPKNTMEYYGLFSAVIERANGSKEDLGLVSCKSVTLQFCEHLVDYMAQTVATNLNDYNQHKMGSGSTAAATGDTALVAAMSGAQAAGGLTAATHGATSIVYRSIGTVTSTYGTDTQVREHGIFNRSTGGYLLDRSTVAAIAIEIDDVITWTYDLTIVTGG